MQHGYPAPHKYGLMVAWQMYGTLLHGPMPTVVFMQYGAAEGQTLDAFRDSFEAQSEYFAPGMITMP